MRDLGISMSKEEATYMRKRRGDMGPWATPTETGAKVQGDPWKVR